MNVGHEQSRLLRAKLAAVRRREWRVIAGTGLAELVLALAGMLALLVALDWRYEWPRPVRAGLLALAAAGGAAVAWRQLGLPLRRRADETRTALRVERTWPELRGRLIAAVQLTQPHLAHDAEATRFVRALVAETEALVGRRDWRPVIPTDRRRRWTLLALAAVATGALAFAQGGEWSRVLVRRVFLSAEPLPHHTRVVCLTGSRKVGRGTTVELAARAEGIVPATGTVRLQSAGGHRAEFALARDGRVFRRTIQSVQESFAYTITLNDGTSGPHRIEVVTPPVVVALRCRQEFPAYTRAAPVDRRATDLTLLAGSTLWLEMTANKQIARATVKLVGLDRELPLRDGVAGVPIPAAGLTGLAIQLVDTDGVASSDEPVYPVTILADQPPAVAITFPPRREELATPRARMVVGLEATDDFGVARLTFHARAGEETGPVKTIELELNGATPALARRRFEWRVPEVWPGVNIGDTITYWFEAEDNNDATGPGRARSERYAVRVVSEDDKRAELLARFGEQLGDVGSIARDQERLNRALGDLIFGKQPQDRPAEE